MPILKTRDGTALYIKDLGEGPPVILIHGWGFNADLWDYQSLALAEAGYRVISYDRRGFGRSDQPWRGYDYDTFADDLSDVVQGLRLDGDMTLVGYSMGSGEVARYMSRHGGRGVTRAVLVGAVVPLLLKSSSNPHGFDPVSFDRKTDELRTDRATFFRSYLRSTFGVGMISHPVSEDTIEWTWQMAMQAGLHSLLAAREAFGRTDFRADLSAFRVPTLVIHGTKDSDAPIDATGRASAAGIVGAQLTEYEDATHGIVITHKERLSKDMLDFMSEPGGA